MPATMVDSLRSQMQRLIDNLCPLVANFEIVALSQHLGEFVVIAPEFHLRIRNDLQRRLRADIGETFRVFEQSLRIVDRVLSEADRRKLKDCKKQIDMFINFESYSNWGISNDPKKNSDSCLQAFIPLSQVLSYLHSAFVPELCLVPDTNSLLRHPTPTAYRVLAQSSSFTFVLTPTVLAELDSLKTTHRNEDVREKARKCINIIKGYRNQGNLREGTKVDKSITVKMIPAEPRFEYCPEWLVRDNNDDRIIATCLEIAGSNPMATVVLVTGDVNLQNKAEMANLNYVESPET